MPSAIAVQCDTAAGIHREIMVVQRDYVVNNVFTGTVSAQKKEKRQSRTFGKIHVLQGTGTMS